MPRVPMSSKIAAGVRASTFGPFGARLQELASRGELIPLHIGDTYLMPPAAARRVDLERRDLYHLGSAEGDGGLREVVEGRVRNLYGFDTQGSKVFVTPGGTGAVSVAAEALFDPGDEVIVLTPTWPVIFGVLERRGVVIREVEIAPDGWPGDEVAFRRNLHAAVSARTAGIYVCDPNNPCGFLYPRSFSKVIAELAIEQDLWIINDIAYIDLIFAEHRDKYSPLPVDHQIAERSVSIGSFTKPFALAGLRVGYIVVPDCVADVVVRLLTHTTLHTSMVGQAMALACLEGEEDRAIADFYRRAVDLVQEHLVADFHPPEAGSFVFLDLRPLSIETHEQTLEFLECCLGGGVSLCPGNVFGRKFEPFVRLCYTTVPEEALFKAIQVVNGVINDWARSH